MKWEEKHGRQKNQNVQNEYFHNIWSELRVYFSKKMLFNCRNTFSLALAFMDVDIFNVCTTTQNNRLWFRDFRRSGMCATFKWCPYTFHLKDHQSSASFYTSCEHKHTSKAEACRLNLSSGCYRRGGPFAWRVSETRGSSSSWWLLQKHAWKKNILHKARGTKQCSAYSHPCTVPLYRCTDACAGPNAAACITSRLWPCMELFHFFHLELCQIPSVPPV